MSRLSTRHERFCRAFVDCANASQAARAAGYAPASARNTGYRLMRRPHILERIFEIQQEAGRAHCRSVDALLGKLETIYRRAIDDRSFSAATRAVELQARLAGVAPSTGGRAARAVAVPEDDKA